MVLKTRPKYKRYPCCQSSPHKAGFIRKGFGPPSDLYSPLPKWTLWYQDAERSAKDAEAFHHSDAIMQRHLLDDGMDCVPGSDRYILLYSLNKRQRWTLLERLRHLAEESAHDIRAHNLHLSVYCHQMYPSFYRSSYDPTRALSLTSTKFAANADLDDGDEQASLCTVYTSRPSGAAVFRNLWENGKRLRGRSDVTEVEDVKDIGYEIGIPWKYDAFYFHKQFHSQQPAYRGRKSSIKTKACRSKVGSQSSNYRFLPPEKRNDYPDVDCVCCWRMHNWVDEDRDEGEYDNSETVPASRPNQFRFDRLEDYISQSGSTRKTAQKRGKKKRRVSMVLEGEYDFCDDESNEYDLCDNSG